MPNAIQCNFAGGETSPKSRGRFDLPWYSSSARKMLNFIAEVAGPARYRPGFRYVRLTRHGQTARFVPFQLSNSSSYMLEFTPGFMRAYALQADGITQDLLTTQPTTVTGLTTGALLTVASAAGLSNGDEIIITGMVGMPQFNNRQVRLSAKSGATFVLVDPVTGGAINATGYTAYVSGGLVNLVSEIVTPYVNPADLDNIQFAQNETEMYLTCPPYPPQKVKISSARVFSLAVYVRTADPFGTPGDVLTITNLVFGGNSPYEVIVYWTAGLVAHSGTKYTFAAVGGTVQVNGNTYLITQVLTPPPNNNNGLPYPIDRWVLKNLDGTNVDFSTFAAYTAGGTATPYAETPLSVAFYEGRLFFLGTDQRPNAVFGSRIPDPATGNTRYDDFTGGADATYAVFYALAPVSGSVDYITWGRGTTDFLIVGTFGGPFRVGGAGLDQPVTNVSVNVRQFDNFGCHAVMPAGGAHVFYLQRGGTTLRTVKVINPYIGTMESQDLCVNAEHIGYSPLTRVAWQAGRPNIVWVLRTDGTLAGASVNVTSVDAGISAGWHRHKMGGDGLVKDIQTLARGGNNDQVWVCVQRARSGGTTYCTAEILSDEVFYPDFEDFYHADGSDDPPTTRARDLIKFNNILYRLQEQAIHLDCVATYNGNARVVTAGTSGAGLSISSNAVGELATFTATVAVFVASDVGSQIWVKPDSVTGLGFGRATIAQYISSTQVKATITEAFNSGTIGPIWHFAINKIYGLSHLEGLHAAVVTDGAVNSDGYSLDHFPEYIVADGTITLANGEWGAVIHVGLPYFGFIETHNLEIGGKTGPAQSKPRDISMIYLRFLNSLGVEYGTDLYRLQHIQQRPAQARTDRPAPVFSGIRKLVNEDESWQQASEKRVYIAQRLPLPATIEFVDVHYQTADEE